ncbi:MAG: tetratricopeptide repeat protein [Bacteroidetes bacterium]|nr:tetratricopeptide repeat protein [Bacteroidota bacterium]
MKYLFLLFISVMSVITPFAQNNSNTSLPYDSLNDINWYKKSVATLLEKVETLADNEEKVLIYLNIISKYDFYKKDSAIIYSLKALKLSEKINSEKGKIRALDFLRMEFTSIGNYFEAIKAGIEALEIAEKIKDSSKILNAYYGLSLSYNESKDYATSLKYSLKLKEYAVANKNKILKDFYYINAITNIGDNYMNLNKIDSALTYFNLAYQISLGLDESEKYIPLGNLGEINYKLKNYEIALSYYKQCVSTGAQNYIDREKLSYFFQAISNAYFDLNKKDSAMHYAKLAYTNSKEGQYQKGVLQSSEKLYKLFKEQKKYDSAFLYQEIFIQTRDSLFNDEKIRIQENFSFREEIRQNEIEEKMKEAEMEREQNIKLGFIAFFIPSFGIGVFLIGMRNKKNIKMIVTLSLASLLMLFEFISMVIHPYIEKITHHDSFLMYIILLIVAFVLIPIQHRLENFVKNKFK